jgi:hypothetical protein
MQGDLIAGHPFFALISRTLTVSTASTPPRAIAALRIKAFNRSNRQKLTSPNARSPFCSPPRILSITLRIDASDSLRPAQQIVP